MPLTETNLFSRYRCHPPLPEVVRLYLDETQCDSHVMEDSKLGKTLDVCFMNKIMPLLHRPAIICLRFESKHVNRGMSHHNKMFFGLLGFVALLILVFCCFVFLFVICSLFYLGFFCFCCFFYIYFIVLMIFVGFFLLILHILLLFLLYFTYK